MTDAALTVMRRIAAIIGRGRCDLSNEKSTQADIETLLRQAGHATSREHRLGPGDIPDFLVEGVAIEVKLRSTSRKNILRQLGRYAAYPEVKAVLLVTNTSIALPATIEEKPALSISLGAAWL